MYRSAVWRSNWPRLALLSLRGTIVERSPNWVMSRPRALSTWKSPPKPRKASVTSLLRESAVEPTTVLSMGFAADAV